jgi:hypothetical protein
MDIIDYWQAFQRHTGTTTKLRHYDRMLQSEIDALREHWQTIHGITRDVDELRKQAAQALVDWYDRAHEYGIATEFTPAEMLKFMGHRPACVWAVLLRLAKEPAPPPAAGVAPSPRKRLAADDALAFLDIDNLVRSHVRRRLGSS